MDNSLAEVPIWMLWSPGLPGQILIKIVVSWLDVMDGP